MKIQMMSLPAVLCAAFLAVGAGAQDSGTRDMDTQDRTAQEKTRENRKPDAWITAKAKTTLAARKNVKAIGTNVDTKNGIVTLRGEVKNAAQKDLAERYVKEIEGVRGVDNQLVVKGEAQREMREDDRGEAIGIEGAGDRAIENIGNAGLTGRVNSALAAHPETSSFQTDVDSDRGSVTLSGTARSNAEKDLAEKVVRGVKGVKAVENQIEVR